MRVSAVILALILLSACESSERKAARLRSEAALACLEARPGNADQVAHDADPNYKESPAEREASVARIAVELQAKCDVATRNFNRFMGR